MSIQGWALLILACTAGSASLLAVIFHLRFKKEQLMRKNESARADEAESREVKLKRNIAHTAAAISTDYGIQKDGVKVIQKIKEAKTDEDAQRILNDLSSRLDGLL